MTQKQKQTSATLNDSDNDIELDDAYLDVISGGTHIAPLDNHTNYTCNTDAYIYHDES